MEFINIKDKIEKLKQSPLFAMSLGEKELFHSNFWEWLIDYNEVFLKVFFSDYSGRIIEVKREEGNRDLTIHIKNNDIGIYVIENKIKSVPYKDQLIKYENEIKSKGINFLGGIVTGFIEPDFIAEFDKWKFLSYREIGERILKGNFNFADSFNKSLIESYAESVILLSDITVNYLPKNTLINTEYDLSMLDRIRFADVVKKINASNFCEYLKNHIEKEIKEMISNKDFNVQIWPGYAPRGNSATIDVRLIKDDGKESEVGIGIQIQGEQYRHSCQVRDLRISANDLYEKYKSLGWFVSNNKNEICFHNKTPLKTKMKYEYCKYEPKKDKYIHVYQHGIISDYSFKNLTQQILNDMKLAIEIVNTNNL